jgi:hypothetical protein
MLRRSALNDLQELEFKNGLRQKVLRQEISEGDLARCLRLFEDDCIPGKIQRKPVTWSRALERAEGISRRLAIQRVCRAFDLFHAAVAVLSKADRFATFDEEQAGIAAEMRLKLVRFPKV